VKGDHIKYRERKYKYQLVEDYIVKIDLIGYSIDKDFFKLDIDGTLTIKTGYAWDGPSGPTIDTPDFMRGSLIHDVLYQMIREYLLPFDCKDKADEILRDICEEDGMSGVRSHYVFWAVQMYGESSCMPGSDKDEIKTAP
jgi:hypothetical protein